MSSGTIKPTHGQEITKFLIGSAIILLATFLCYAPAIRGGFIWDDNLLVAENPLIHAPDGLYRFWFTTQAPDYFPLTSTTWWLEWRMWGMNPTGYHVINLLLHIGSSILFWLSLRHLNIPGAWLAGMLFAIHPVHVESVAWIAERKNTLSMFFYMFSLLFFLQFDHCRRRIWYIFSLVSFLLALLSKTSVVMLPFILLGFIWWRRGRISRRDILRVIPFFILSAVLALVTIWFQYNRAIDAEIIRADGLASRLAVAGCAVWFYLYKLLLPINLSLVYPRWEMDASSFLSYVPGIILLVIMFVLWRYRNGRARALFLGLGSYVISLFPVLGFFNIYLMRYALVADHWQYTPSAGIIALLAGLWGYWHGRLRPSMRPAAVMAATAAVLLLGGLTWQQSRAYANAQTMWRNVLAKDETVWMAHDHLAGILMEQGRLDQAEPHFRRALELKGDHIEGLLGLADLLARQGQIHQAIDHYGRAIKIRPDFVDSYYYLARALTRRNDNLDSLVADQETLARTLALMSEGARQIPESPLIANNFGLLWLKLNQPQNAAEEFSRALRMIPNAADIHFNLGVALEAQGKIEQAIQQYERSLSLKADFEPAMRSLHRLKQQL